MSKVKSISLSLAALVAIATAALADKPPATAKKLDAAGIAKHYQGAYVSFDDVRDKVKGEKFYDITKKVIFGTYSLQSGDKGIFRAKARVKDNQLCYQSGGAKEVCQDVFKDGDSFYLTSADGTITSIDTLLSMPPKPPTSAPKIPASTILELVKGKRILATVYDSKKPIVADVKWETKKSRVVGKYIFGGEPEGKVNVKFKVKGDQICVQNEKAYDCYVYYEIPNGFVEINDKGAVHAISTY